MFSKEQLVVKGKYGTFRIRNKIRTAMELEFPVVLKKLEVMTDDEFFLFCRVNDPIEFERDKHGNIIIVSPTDSKTGNINLTLASRVFLWNEEIEAGYTFDSSTGFKLPNGATHSPDVAWIQKESWNVIHEEQQEKFAPICPDFIIELRSASDDLKYLQDKMEEYRENGCRLGWLIDRKTQQVFIALNSPLKPFFRLANRCRERTYCPALRSI